MLSHDIGNFFSKYKLLNLDERMYVGNLHLSKTKKILDKKLNLLHIIVGFVCCNIPEEHEERSVSMFVTLI